MLNFYGAQATPARTMRVTNGSFDSDVLIDYVISYIKLLESNVNAPKVLNLRGSSHPCADGEGLLL